VKVVDLDDGFGHDSSPSRGATVRAAHRPTD
jgi:hypothetical protein